MAVTVKATTGDTLSGIAKANGTTVAQILTDNPTLAARAAAGSTVLFNNTSVKITAPSTATNPYGANSAGQGAGLGTASVPISSVNKVLTPVATPAAATTSGISSAESLGLSDRAVDQRLADAAAKTAADSAAKAAADAAAKAAQDAAAKAAADAAAKAAADATAKAAADKAAADEAAKNAKTDAERAAAKAAQDAADAAAARAAADAANAARGNGNNYSYSASGTSNVGSNNINTSGNVQLASVNAADTTAADYAKAQAALEKEQARQSTIAVMQARFKQYGLETLAEKIKQLAIDGATEATITLQLQESPEYQMRFKANAVRLKNNLQVLTPAEYLNLEDGYRQVLRSYGLEQFNNDEYVSQFIANDMSATELSTRVSTAVQRIQNADPAIAKTLKDYYGIGQADLVGYMLDPAQNINKIQRQVSAAEIGTAARIQGLETGVGVAEQLASQGVTQAQAQKGYSTIADILPTAEKLSAIYGTTTDGYGQSTAEQDVFNNLASAQRARQKLTAAEIASFSASSGTSKAALNSGKNSQY